MWFGTFPNVFFIILCVPQLINGKPFLYNGPRALTTLVSSASASASSPSEPITNIADLRRKQQKAEALQQEKQLGGEETDSMVFLAGDEDEMNEAAPSLFQKKINKILTKIRIISSLSNAVGGSGGTDETNTTTGNDKDDEFRREFEEFDREFEHDVLNQKDAENDTETVPTFQKVIYPNSESAAPVKVSFDISPRIVNRKQSQVAGEIDDVEDELDDMVETMGRLSQIGVFFAELLGSVVGLVYGAAAQINNVAQGSTTISII